MARKNKREDGEDTQQLERIQNTEPNLMGMIGFDTWWMLAEKRLKLRSDTKEAVKRHFKARGYLVSGDFEAGIKDFGIR